MTGFRASPPILAKELPIVELEELHADDTVEQVQIANRALRGITANAVTIEGAVFKEAEISSSKLRRSSLSDVLLQDCLLFGTDCDSSNWLRVELQRGLHSGLSLTGCSLQDVVIVSAKFDLANFRASKLKRVKFQDCDLTKADFQGAILTDVTFIGCNLNQAEFSNCKLSRVDLRGSDIATIKGVASLGGAKITTAQLLSIANTLALEAGLTVED